MINIETCIIAMYSILVFVCPIFRAVGDCVIRDLQKNRIKNSNARIFKFIWYRSADRVKKIDPINYFFKRRGLYHFKA